MVPDDQRRAFIASMREMPDDDVRRLVYADWLDERNDPAAFEQREAVALRRVLATPDDDRPRLEYAAVCEQYASDIQCQCGGKKFGELLGRPQLCHRCEGAGKHSDGRKDRADFIRASLRLEELRWTPEKGGRPTFAVPELVADGIWDTVQYCVDSDEVSQLVTLTNSLAGRWYEKWFADCAFIGRHRRGWIDTVTLRLSRWCGGVCGRCGGAGYHHYGREIERHSCAGCLGTPGRAPALGPQLVHRQPITTVRVNLTPLVERFDSSFLARWTDIPADVHRHLGANEWSGRTADEAAENAHQGLSAALILWAKEQPIPSGDA